MRQVCAPNACATRFKSFERMSPSCRPGRPEPANAKPGSLVRPSHHFRSCRCPSRFYLPSDRRGNGELVGHRSATPWDDDRRRPSHADKRRELMGEEIVAVLRRGRGARNRGGRRTPARPGRMTSRTWRKESPLPRGREIHAGDYRCVLIKEHQDGASLSFPLPSA